MALQHQRKFRDRDRYIDRDRERQLDIKTHHVMIQIYKKKDTWLLNTMDYKMKSKKKINREVYRRDKDRGRD